LILRAPDAQLVCRFVPQARHRFINCKLHGDAVHAAATAGKRP
jgi:hypothetical protein